MNTDCMNAPTTFPDADWADPFRNAHEHQPQVVELFDRKRLALAPPPGPAHCSRECGYLLEIKPQRADRLGQIRRQALSDLNTIQPVLDVLQIDIARPPNPDAAALRELIQDNIWGPIFMFKKRFCRPRPWNTCGGSLQPLFARPDRLYPGHPSYPSGHASMVYTWAYLLSHFQPTHQQQLMAAAADVAFNREVAGVHFPSDTAAGHELGQQMARLILESPRFDAGRFGAVMSV